MFFSSGDNTFVAGREPWGGGWGYSQKFRIGVCHPGYLPWHYLRMRQANKGQTPRNDTLFKRKKQELQWNLDVMNLYVMKSSL